MLAGNALATELGTLMRTGHADHASFGGKHMERTFGSYVELPLGESALMKAGWHKSTTYSGCDPQLGVPWTQDPSGPTKSHPMTLYTTAGGQPAGVGIVILGHGQDSLPGPQKKWATTGSPDLAHLDVAFRKGDIMCSGSKDAVAIGDTLIVNPKRGSASPSVEGQSKILPLTESDAQAQGWHRGSCFDGMGWHWFLDTSIGKNKLSWKAENLFPVVTMYNEGEINAIFFASTINQVSIPFIRSNEWEPLPLSNSRMCKNLCDKDCTFSGMTRAGPWSTAHIFFRDHKSVTCDSKLKCGIRFPFRANCCEARSDVVV